MMCNRKLTAQWRAENPELISDEKITAALLEKIKAQRAASTGKKPRVENADQYLLRTLLVRFLFFPAR